ncbi:MAG: hypothetical protein Q8S21_06810 [Candidatus Paracaedibacteraceae bacterium]|nr:hypothetical protein [Candidatus Paracaedibacteraceae bacterium]
MPLSLLKKSFIYIIFLTNFASFVHSAEEWGWRQSLNVDVRTDDRSLKIIETNNLHHQMYALETLISPYVQYSGHHKNTGHPANICIGAITLLVQCSPDLVCSVTIPVQNELNEKIIFCSQKNSKLHSSFLATEKLSFSPEDSHPENATLQNFLETLKHPKFASYDSHHSALKKSRKEDSLAENPKLTDMFSKKRPSNASSEGGASSIASSGVFGMKFQHTEQKMVYYLLQNNGRKLRDHIHHALTILSPAITNIPSYYNNIVGLILHVHTRLDVCENCNDSLVLFRKNALAILNAPIAEDEETDRKAAAFSVEHPNQNTIDIPTINASVLVTVSSRARNDTNREITGYDDYWKGSHDLKKHGHMTIQLKPAAEIRELELNNDLKDSNLNSESSKDIEIINIDVDSTMKETASTAYMLCTTTSDSTTSDSAASSSGIIVNYAYPSPNCHSIFPDVLQRFVFN